jgi:hypothetical protein
MSTATDAVSILSSLTTLIAVAAEQIRVSDERTYQELCHVHRTVFELASLAKEHAEKEPTL